MNNDFGFLAIIDPATVSTLGLLQPKHGTVSTMLTELYFIHQIPAFSASIHLNTMFVQHLPVVCDIAQVVVKISTCPSNGNQNVISGQIFLDKNKDGNNNDGGKGVFGVKVYLFADDDCNGTIFPTTPIDSVTVDSSGFYQFIRYPERTYTEISKVRR